MAWNSIRALRGAVAADETIRNDGIEEALAAYDALEGSAAVDEYEVGFRGRLHGTLAYLMIKHGTGFSTIATDLMELDELRRELRAMGVLK